MIPRPAASSQAATGWASKCRELQFVAGLGGLEWAVWSRWTLKAEYLYVSLDSKPFTEAAVDSGGGVPASFNTSVSRTNFNVVRAGVNYRF
jgi:opacity protein-like surface antigen